MTGALNEAATLSLASATTTNIGAQNANTITITGTTTITAFDTVAAGVIRRLVFAGALTLTHNATSLILPGAANITTAAGDVFQFLSLGSGNWRCIGSIANGSLYALLSGATFTGTVSAANATADGHLLNRITADGRYPPRGSIFWFAASAAPTGYLKANGAAISRTTYAALFAVIGTTFGVGDGSTTFNLPDLRGEFIRGWDDGRGIDSGRVFGSAQASDFASHNHTVTDPGHIHFSGIRFVDGGSSTPWAENAFNIAGTSINTGSSTTGITIANAGGTDTRPRSIALLAVIKF